MRLIAACDLAIAFGVPLLAMISWIAPQRSWPAISRLCRPFYAPMLLNDPLPDIARRVRRHLAGRPVERSAEAILRDLVAEDILALIELLRDYRPGRWRPAIEVEGRDNVDAALADGHGAILWIGHFVHCNLVAKMAFHRSGLAVSHLSHPRHGFSSTRFGIRFLNRFRTAIEDRYLNERVLLAHDGSASAMAELRARLGRNEVVSISVGSTARRAVSVPFLGGAIPLAAGAPSLAHRTGAALLPVFPVRDRSGGFTVFIGAPLGTGARGDRSAFVDSVMRQYGDALGGYVLRYPDQWLGWYHL